MLATRHDLRLGLHRLRLEGELTEIRAADLRFSVVEARELLAAAGVALPEPALAATAALVWNGDLPRPLQQILFDAADGIAPPDPAWASSTDAKVK